MELSEARLLDRGAEAEIYEWGPGRVLRLLPPHADLGRVEREAEVMRAASAGGVPVPAVHELLTVDGRAGMVMDRLDGGPMLSVMLGRPWRLLPLVRRFGAIQARMHGVRAPEGVASAHEWSRAQLAKLEDTGLRERAEGELEQLAGGDSLLHGDYHPLNLLMADGEPEVIDWPGAAAGPPEADIARTWVLIETADPPNGSPLMLKLMGAFRKHVFIPRYLRAYERVRPIDRALLHRWLVVKAIDRLAEAPAHEAPALRKMIERSSRLS